MYLDGLVCVSDEGDEETEHHVDEERDEGVQIHSAEQPHHRVLLLKLGKCGKHVVSIDQREEALSHSTHILKLNTHMNI